MLHAASDTSSEPSDLCPTGEDALHNRMGSGCEQSADALLGGRSVLIVGSAQLGLEMVPRDCVQTAITSPPYWGLRNYGMNEQIGREASVADYVQSIVEVFGLMAGALREDGTVWLNIGDCYTSGGRSEYGVDTKNQHRASRIRPATPDGKQGKDLLGLPWMIASALQEDGWIVRSEVIWYKPNGQPESVRDRPAKSHESVFLLSRQQQYKYLPDAWGVGYLRTVWPFSVSGERGLGEHPAVMPLTLAKRCIALTSDPGDIVLDPFAGAGTTLVAAESMGRTWAGIELNPSFADTAEQRLAQMRGREAHLPGF